MINKGLENYWEQGNFEQKQKEMKEESDPTGFYRWGYGFSYSMTDNQYLANAIFGPPSIILQPSGNDLSSIEYQLLIRSGELQVAHSTDATKNTIPSTGPDGEPVPKPKNPFAKASTTRIQYYSKYKIDNWKVSVPIKMGEYSH